MLGCGALDGLLLDPHGLRERCDHFIKLIKLRLRVLLKQDQVSDHLIHLGFLILVHRLQLHVTRSSALQALL